MVYNKYKQIKRDIAKREQQRRLNWFMSVVRVNSFGRKLLRRARENIRLKNLQKEKERKEQMMQKRRQTLKFNPNTMSSE